MSTLYLQVDDADEDSYPVRSGLVDVDQPGAVSLESIGVLPVTLPPRAAGMSEGAYLHGLIADAGGASAGRPALGRSGLRGGRRPPGPAGRVALGDDGCRPPGTRSSTRSVPGHAAGGTTPACRRGRWARSGCSSSSATRGTRACGRRRNSTAFTAPSPVRSAGSTWR